MRRLLLAATIAALVLGVSSPVALPLQRAGDNSEEGGTGGRHYSETSQYDVACLHVSMR